MVEFFDEKSCISLMLSLVLSLSFVAGCNDNSSQKNSDNKNTVYKSDDGKYYVSGAALYNISDPDKPIYVSYNDPDSENSDYPKYFCMNRYRMAQNGSEIIGGYTDHGKIYKWNIGTDNTISGSVLYESDAWVGEIKEKLKKYSSYTDEDFKTISKEMMNYCFDCTDGADGYIYFRYTSQLEYFNDYIPMNFVLGRYDKNGGGMEFIGDDIGVVSFDCSDGYIYYADNGFKALSEHEFSVDSERAGIYRMKTDGTDVKKLVSVSPASEEEKNVQTHMLNNIAGRVEVIGDELYYIAEDKTGDTYLYSISVDGGSPKQITKKPCADYYIDTDSETLYFKSGTMNMTRAEGCTVYSMLVNGGEETALYIKGNAPTRGNWAAADGDYLYITNYNLFVGFNTDEGEYLSGQRFNLKTKEMENLICKAKTGTKSLSEIDIQWVKADRKNGGGSLALYP